MKADFTFRRLNVKPAFGGRRGHRPSGALGLPAGAGTTRPTSGPGQRRDAASTLPAPGSIQLLFSGIGFYRRPRRMRRN